MDQGITKQDCQFFKIMIFTPEGSALVFAQATAMGLYFLCMLCDVPQSPLEENLHQKEVIITICQSEYSENLSTPALHYIQNLSKELLLYLSILN